MSKIGIVIATPEDWELCKQLRIQSVTGDDRRFFNSSSSLIKFEELKTKAEWELELSSRETFYVLSRYGSEVVGMGRAVYSQQNVWGMFSGYVKPEFRGKHIGQTMFAFRLNEIQERGGEAVYSLIFADNVNQLNLCKKFGFTNLYQGCGMTPVYYQMGMYLSPGTDWLKFLEEKRK